eukprot:15452962-Alexandrium_andersonii.AAC.1
MARGRGRRRGTAPGQPRRSGALPPCAGWPHRGGGSTRRPGARASCACPSTSRPRRLAAEPSERLPGSAGSARVAVTAGGALRQGGACSA